MALKRITCIATALSLTVLVFLKYHMQIETATVNVRGSGKDFSWDTIAAHHKLKWKDCYESQFQCARLLVPFNYSEPDANQGSIALIRKRSTVASSLYRGPILFNPGGPGESGVDLVREAGRLFSTIVGPQFDIVGFDPRGVARSLPKASSFKTEVERELWLEGVQLLSNSSEGVGRAWARAHVLGKLTAENDDGYLRHINTDQTARDMLRIVEAHARDKLQYWGFSYGSVLGATFAAMFPDKVERMIIDGVMDSENYYATLWSYNLQDTDKAMDYFYDGCADAGPDGCAFWAPNPEDVRKNLTTLYENIRRRPIPVRTKSGYGIVDYKMLHSAIFESLYTPYFLFPKLANGLAALAAGDGSLIFDMIDRKPLECGCRDHPSSERVEDGVMAILCNDGNDIPSDLASTQEYVNALTKSSHWGDLWSRIRTNCVGWPRFSKNHFQGPFDASTSHPILLIGNTADPVTPLSMAHKMSTKFPGSVVLTQNSVGHCSIAAPSICTMKYVEDYFNSGNLPEPGTVCQPESGPFPSDISSVNKEEHIQALLSSLSGREKELYVASMEFIKTTTNTGKTRMPGLLALPRVSRD